MRVYDSSCRHLLSFGRSGQGPGEFSAAPLGISVVGDRVHVRQSRGGFTQGPAAGAVNVRTSVFSLAGQHVKDIGEGAGSGTRLCCGFRVSLTSSPIRLTTREAPTMSIVLESNSVRDTLANGASGSAIALSGGSTPGTRVVASFGGRFSIQTLADTMFVILDGYTGTLRYYVVSNASSRARLVRTTNLGIQGPAVTTAERRRQLEAARVTFGPRAEVVMPERWSLVNRVWNDGTRLWLQPVDPAYWIVVPMLGDTVARYRTPDGLRVLVITPTHMIGVTETPNGAHVLNRYRLPPDLAR